MRVIKLILIVQAIITLVIGIALLSQVLEIDDSIDESSSFGLDSSLSRLEFVQERFYQGSYVLILISCLEFIIIWRILK